MARCRSTLVVGDDLKGKAFAELERQAAIRRIRYTRLNPSSCASILCERGQNPPLSRGPFVFRPTPGELMPRPPNYKQQKQRREDAQKRKNQEEQQRKAERKNRDLPQQPDSH
jgi:hypothetical protein